MQVQVMVRLGKVLCTLQTAFSEHGVTVKHGLLQLPLKQASLLPQSLS